MRRSVRSLSAWLALFTLLFAQLATAVYACPQLADPAPAVESQDCDHDTDATPNLCQRHCDQGKASLDSPRLAVAPDMAPTYERPLLLVATHGAPRVSTAAQVPTGPPATRFTVLRI
jgi:hypothetical protein